MSAVQIVISHRLDAQRAVLADLIVLRQFEQQP